MSQDPLLEAADAKGALKELITLAEERGKRSRDVDVAQARADGIEAGKELGYANAIEDAKRKYDEERRVLQQERDWAVGQARQQAYASGCADTAAIHETLRADLAGFYKVLTRLIIAATYVGRFARPAAGPGLNEDPLQPALTEARSLQARLKQTVG